MVDSRFSQLPPLTRAQLICELQEAGFPHRYKSIRLWHPHCHHLDGEAFTPDLDGCYSRPDFDRIIASLMAHKTAVETGSLQDKDGLVLLSVEKAGELLKKNVSTDNTPAFFRHERISRGTFIFLEKLWHHKRGELLPQKDVELPFSRVRFEGRPGSRWIFFECTWYVMQALIVLKKWLMMKPGHYGTASEPRLDRDRAAEHVGCDPATLMKKVAPGVLDIIF